MALSPKHTRFVAEYLKDLNATQAAIRAGYKSDNANVTGPRLLANVGIASEIAKRTEKAVERLELSAERVLEEYARVAYSDVRDLFDDAGNMLPIKQLPAHVAASIAGVEVNKRNLTAGDGQIDTVLKVKRWDKVKALDSLAQYFGLLKGTGPTVNNITITINTPW